MPRTILNLGTDGALSATAAYSERSIPCVIHKFKKLISSLKFDPWVMTLQNSTTNFVQILLNINVC